jgi:hypothetical protein
MIFVGELRQAEWRELFVQNPHSAWALGKNDPVLLCQGEHEKPGAEVILAPKLSCLAGDCHTEFTLRF